MYAQSDNFAQLTHYFTAAQENKTVDFLDTFVCEEEL